MLDLNNRRFLVGTGASYSILPHQSSLPATGPMLFSPASQLIPWWGDSLVLSNETIHQSAALSFLVDLETNPAVVPAVVLADLSSHW